MEVSILSLLFSGSAPHMAPPPQVASANEASAKFDAILAKYDPHHMSRREAAAMMHEMEQAGLLPQGKTALEMVALHRPGESVWNVDNEAKFDIVDAVRANYASVVRSGNVDARSAAFVKVQHEVWNSVAERAAKRA